MKRLSPNQKKTHRGSKAERRRVPSRSELQQELTEVARHRAAISQVLRVIASSPHDLQPIFDTILDHATHLCRAEHGSLMLFQQSGYRVVTNAGLLDQYLLTEKRTSIRSFQTVSRCASLKSGRQSTSPT